LLIFVLYIIEENLQLVLIIRGFMAFEESYKAFNGSKYESIVEEQLYSLIH